MIVAIVTIHVKPQYIDDFIDATSKNHEGSLREPGIFRFDLLRRRDDPSAFLLYEVYESAEAADGHLKTKHYQEWRDAVAPWMAEPRFDIVYDAVFPKDKTAWK